MNIYEKRIKEYNELIKGEEEIIKELNKPGGLNEKKYKIYYLLDDSSIVNYKNLIISKNFGKFDNFLKVSLIQTKRQKKDFSYIHTKFKFTFSYNFTLVTQNFIELFFKNFHKTEQKELKKDSYKIIIGGKCLIIKDKDNDSSPYRCITLYNENKKI